MFSTARKVNLIKVMVGTVLLISTLAGVNTVFAADDHNVNSNSNTSLVQRADDNTLIEHVAGFLFSLITPKDACAATVVVTCRDFCKNWGYYGEEGFPCCKAWVEGTPQECITAWDCPEQPQ